MATNEHLSRIVIFKANLMGAGGEERLLWEEEKYFRRMGVETIILTFSFNIDSLFNYKPEKLEIIKAKPSFLSRVIALHKKIKQISPDVVIASSQWSSTYLYFALKSTSIPYIIHIHGTSFWFIGDNTKYAFIHKKQFSEIRKSVIGHKEFIAEHPHLLLRERIVSELSAIIIYIATVNAGRIITLTDQLKWEIKKLYGIDSVVARGCLPPEALSFQSNIDMKLKLNLQGKKIILSIGRLDPRKRIDILIKAFARILPKHDDLYLVIGGKGKDEKRLKELAKDLGIAERVKFLGFIPDSELFDYYAACDVFGFPSWTTSGITPYEALAVGKKVVWTSEADEPILGDSHVFVAEPNEEDFADGLEEALNTKVEEETDLSDYTWEMYFETVYRAIVEPVKKQSKKASIWF
jgi:glycosyltransferase involved in cell wall biosynthesis